jgi:hypothetical protein
MPAQNINGYTQENIVDVLPANSCRPISFKPCKPQINFNSNNNSTMNLQNPNHCATQIIVQSPEPKTNPLPTAVNPILFDVQANNSTGSSKVLQNSILKFIGVGLQVEQSQTVDNQVQTTNIKLTALGGGAGTPYTGAGIVTVNGSTIGSDFNLAPFSGTLPAGRGLITNEGKYITSLPASFITGLTASTAETPNGTVASPTVLVTLSGANNRNIKADAIISGNSGNQLSNNNGLFVPQFVESTYTANAGVKKVGNNFSLDTTTIPANSIPISTLNNFQSAVVGAINSGIQPFNGVYQIAINNGNATLQAPIANGGTTYTVASNSGLTLSGSNVIGTNIPQIASLFTPVSGVAPTGVPFLFANGNAYNQIPASAISGLPSIVNTPLTANDSTTIDFTTSGTDNHTITGVIKVSSAANNALTVNPDGLFATIGGTATAYTANQGVALNGVNFQLNPATIIPGSIPATAISGLPTFSETVLTTQDTTSIDFTTTGVNGHQLTGFVKISSDANNLLTQTPTGLFVTGATSGGSVSTLSGDVTGTSAATTVAKIRGVNVSPTAPTAGQSLVFNGTDLIYSTPTASVSAVNIAGAPSTTAANLSKFQTDTATGATFFVDPTGVLVPLSPVLSKTIGFYSDSVVTGTIAPGYVGYDIIRVPSMYTKVVLETVDFIVKNDSTNTISGSIVLEIQDSSGATIANSGSLAYPAAGATSRTTISIPAGNRVKGQSVELTAKVISGGNVNLGVNAEITGFAGK